ncbi:hypothetical protein CBR_g34269 [Chara braunii]|uniref:Uncharacterized protein n=1 Tax=Chara braunii TaxID=69332 RepID=A0A388JYP9_CHABU|nr:hypothetical protein CBR_g34269 [Chara braunii]|eukprot:GBG62897.1 hypothetical protein CBR_g34269 [Chara braunii]
MGTNVGPEIANLTLYWDEAQFIGDLRQRDLRAAQAYAFTYRFIDDILSWKTLPPSPARYGLEWKDTTEQDGSCLFLGARILVRPDGSLRIGVFDKAENWTFPVIRYPSASSNAPAHQPAGVLTGQLTRFEHLCNNTTDFKAAVTSLTRHVVRWIEEEHRAVCPDDDSAAPGVNIEVLAMAFMGRRLQFQPAPQNHEPGTDPNIRAYVLYRPGHFSALTFADSSWTLWDNGAFHTNDMSATCHVSSMLPGSCYRKLRAQLQQGLVATPDRPPEVRMVEKIVERDVSDEKLTQIKEQMRKELEQSMQKSVSDEALKSMKEELEQKVPQRRSWSDGAADGQVGGHLNSEGRSLGGIPSGCHNRPGPHPFREELARDILFKAEFRGGNPNEIADAEWARKTLAIGLLAHALLRLGHLVACLDKLLHPSQEKKMVVALGRLWNDCVQWRSDRRVVLELEGVHPDSWVDGRVVGQLDIRQPLNPILLVGADESAKENLCGLMRPVHLAIGLGVASRTWLER